jgi:redox-sensitive bicupin YhaK (pirin superfamily)
MIKIYAYEQLGHANHGWLDARHHFSFASYYNPERMGFGALRVINDDIIKAGAGFDTHPHRDMEIITYVRKGAITHRDSRGNLGRTEAGDVQVMSAGTGIFHSEFNLESEDTSLYQIWIEPNKTGVEPRWDAREFPTEETEGRLTLLVSGDGRAPLQIHQDAAIYAGRISAGSELEHLIKHQAYLLVSKGAITLDGHSLKQGDGAEIRDRNSINLVAVTDADVLIIDVPERAR